MLLLINMNYLNSSRCRLGFILLLLAGCSPKADEPQKVESLEPKVSTVDAKNLEDSVAATDTPKTSENIIDNAIDRFGITLKTRYRTTWDRFSQAIRECLQNSGTLRIFS
jgi:negative regulator of replication initiation